MSELHDAAAIGFDRAGAVYDRARPGYPDAIVEAILQAIPSGTRVCDLAAGTGKLTRALQPHVRRLVAAEPVAGMRRFLADGGTVTVAASAERLPFADGCLGAVTVAQAFHWFDADAALGELYRVLAPGGVLAIVFNVRDDSVGWVGRLWDRLDVYDAERKIPRHRMRSWEPVLRLDGRFEPSAGRLVVEHAQPHDVEQLVERVSSVSFVAALADDDRAEALRIVREVCATDPELQGRSRFAYPYRCELDLLRRV